MGNTRKDLEEALRSIEGVEKPPPGVLSKKAHSSHQSNTGKATEGSSKGNHNARRHGPKRVPKTHRDTAQDETALVEVWKTRAVNHYAVTTVTNLDICPITVKRRSVIQTPSPATSREKLRVSATL